MSWRHRALCFGADPSIFVPETCPEPVTFPPPIVTALCPVCPVRDECESYGRTSASSGWWGGSFLFWGMAMDEWKPWIVRPTAELQCVVCGDTFTSVQTTAIYCTNRCQMREFRARRRSRNTAERAIIQLPDSAGNSNPVDSTGIQLPARVANLVCTVCKTPFTAKRADALYCSTTCAQITRVPKKIGVLVTLSLVVEVAA
jgi:predicted nucleic acid-binding Zn ribbon protein